MALLARTLTFLGLTFLTHAIYSGYEYSFLPSDTQVPLPLSLDVRLETVVSTLVLLVALVLHMAPLRPIRWNQWAGRIEREGWEPNVEGSGQKGNTDLGKGGRGNPYKGLEERRGFWDVRAQRKDFADWVREGAQKDAS
ncbi:MAG: hypothetical protein M1828_006435 [Chrysothrix sp. TS-e1954]|nr:MAG: hypothetical protein M1828_006435 [Chrysothrix sp. TS-e1954]